MDTQRFGKPALYLGIFLMVMAFLWWAETFKGVISAPGFEPIVCIASSSPECLFFEGHSKLPYQPWVFWLGAGLAALGFVVSKGHSIRR